MRIEVDPFQNILGYVFHETGWFVKQRLGNPIIDLHRVDNIQTPLRACNGHIHEATLLLQSICVVDGLAGREPAVQCPYDKDGVPLQSFG